MTRPSSLFLAIWSLTTAVTTCSAFCPASSSVAARGSLTPLHVSSALPFGNHDHQHQPQQQQQQDVHEETVHLPHGVHAPITAINSPQELAEFLEQDDRLCVIKFHAAWCKSCQRFGVKFQGLANQKADWVQDEDESQVVQPGQMRFGSIEFGANKGMCKKLNIKRLPTVHFYQKGQQLDEFPCGPSKLPRLIQTIDDLLAAQQQSNNNEALEATLQEGDKLMSSAEVAGVLQDLMQQQAEGTLETKMKKPTKASASAPAATKASSSGKKSLKWWNPMP